MGGYTVVGGEFEISGKTRNQPDQYLSLRCKCYRKKDEQHCTSSIRVLITGIHEDGRRVLDCNSIKSTKSNYQHSKGCPYWTTNKELGTKIKAFNKTAFPNESDQMDEPANERPAKIRDQPKIEDSRKQHSTIRVEFLKFKELVRVELDLKQKELDLKEKEIDLVRREADLKIEKLQNELNFYKSIVQKTSESPLDFLQDPQAGGKLTFTSSEDSMDTSSLLESANSLLANPIFNNSNPTINNNPIITSNLIFNNPTNPIQNHLVSQLLALLNASNSNEN